MISPKPSDPRVSTINLVFSNMPPKKGTLLPKSVEINMATATINARNFVSSHKILDILLNKNFSREDILISVGGGIVGDIAGWAMWLESLPDQAIVDLYNAGFTHDLGTTTGTAYTSTQTGNLKITSFEHWHNVFICITTLCGMFCTP